MEIAKILSFSHYDDKMMHFLDPALRKANLYQTYAKLTPHSYAVRMKHMNATLSIIVGNKSFNNKAEILHILKHICGSTWFQTTWS